MSKGLRVSALALGVVATALAGYAMFRTSSIDNRALGVINFHREWGRITKVSVDANRDGRIDGEYVYTWNRPYIGNHGNDPATYREDRNHDGRWDTWRDMSTTVLAVDIDGDEMPDVELDATQSGLAYAKARELRGF